MTEIDVVGGVYGERCAFPDWDHIYGSAGRAAAALSSHVDSVRLHTLLPPQSVQAALLNIEQFGVEVRHRKSEQFIGFDYLHCLADPLISPRPDLIKQQPPLQVEANRMVQFGMMECRPQTRSSMCVYDPQSPSSPLGFHETGCRTDRLAFVTNALEARRLTAQPDIAAAGGELVAREGAEVAIVKNGLHGAHLFQRGRPEQFVPAYKTDHVFTVGSGDVFVAAFAYGWMIKGMPADAAADYASRVTAAYVESSALPMIDESAAVGQARAPVVLKGGRVYLAGPFREPGQRYLIDDARATLVRLGMTVFSPVHDIGNGPAEEVVRQDLEALDQSEVVFAILNAGTAGTMFEVGYAVGKSIPVYGVAQNVPKSDLKLPIGSGCNVYGDYVTALHQIAWRP